VPEAEHSIGTANRDAGATGRPAFVLRVILLVAVVSSIFHYTDNYIRFDEYPQDEPELVTRPMVPLSWLALSAFAVLGYTLYRRGRWAPAAACLAVYSISGLISPLHYASGALSEFDTFQHLFILTDGIAGLAVLGFAAWLVLARQPHRFAINRTPGPAEPLR
jgi:hypothetical protein